MESDPTANATERWVVSILFGGLLGAAQNWFRRRSQQKQTETLLQELKPPQRPSDDDLRAELRALADLQREQHAANIVRIGQLEAQYGGITANIEDLKQDGTFVRKEMEGIRGENRLQTQMLQTLLNAVIKK